MSEKERDSEDRHIFGSMDNLRDILMSKFAGIENRIGEEILRFQEKFEILELDSKKDLMSLFKGVLSIRLGLSKLQLDAQHYCHLPTGTPQDVSTPHSMTFGEIFNLMHDHVYNNQPVVLSEFKDHISKLVQPDDLRPLDSYDGSIAVAINKQVTQRIRGNSTSLATERETLLQRVREIEAILKVRAESTFNFH